MEDDATTGVAPVDDGGNQPQTINGIAVDENGQAIPVPEETAADTPAEEPTKPAEAPTEPETPKGAQEAVPDDNQKKLQSFAKGQGINDLSELSDREMSLLKSAYDNKADRDRTTQQLQKTTEITPEQIAPDATPEQRDNIRVRNLELKYEASQWKQANPDKAAYEPQMVELLTADPGKRLLVQEGYLTYDDLHAMVKGRASADTSSIVNDTKRETLQNLANKQQAAVPRGSAVNGAPTQSESAITPQNVDRMVAAMSPDEYRKRLPEINRALSGT